ncbi:RteC domain-containing protein [Sphingobacterium sp. CZ-2]|uniref:RteC domain-containing protein n=1 Tax=Sphingobacterium sp. CZ-2 TaxID=2557994 RepID=UPI001FD7155D|nr:RteC domain-containing protein [Sphingobacterium sp. CZ-2]
MDKFYNDKLHKLETVINDFEIEADCSIQRIETVIHQILECLSEMKGYVLKRGFKNTDEEIRFFKYQKPAIVAKLIYYNAIYKIETKKAVWRKTYKEIPQQRTEKAKKILRQ